MIGELVGKYRIDKLLGAGGMGEVYLATDTLLNRTVAIKFLPRDLESRERVVLRFLREARACARLTHPNIARLYDVGVHENRHFILLEYVDGEPLSRMLRRERLPLKDALHFAIQIADALGEAHEQGILHRDIKPANVLITRKQKVKVLDFGLAKFIDTPNETPQDEISIVESEQEASNNPPLLLNVAVDRQGKNGNDDLTREGVLVGTPRYMSPEQILGKPADTRSDIFSLGILLYEMFAGQHPFKVDNNSQLVHIIPVVDPPPLRSLAPDIPDDLLAITMKALAKKPAERYQNVQDLANELRSVFSKHYQYTDLPNFLEDSSIPPRPSIPSGPLFNNPSSSDKLTQEADLFATSPINASHTMQPLLPEVTGSGPAITIPRRYSWAILSALIILVGLGSWSIWRTNWKPSAPTKIPLIAVMYFDNSTQSDTYNWLSGGMADLLTTDLAQLPTIEVVSKQRIQDMLQQLGNQDVTKLDREKVIAAAQKIGVDDILYGSVFKTQSGLRINIRLEQLSTGKVLFSDTLEGPSIEEIFALVDTITIKLSRHYAPQVDPKIIPLDQVTTSSVEAFQSYTKGVELAWATNFDQGIPELEEATTIDPEFALAYLQLGNARFVRGDVRGSQEAIKNALKYIDHAGAREQALIQGVAAYYQAYDTGNYDPALKIFAEMETRYPQDKEVFLWQGLSQWRNGDYKKAVISYQKIFELDPDFNEVYISLAQAYADDQDYQNAVLALRKTSLLHPEQPDAYHLLGNVYMRMSQYDEAIKYYTLALDKKPTFRDFRPHLVLAQAYDIVGNVEASDRHLQDYLQLTSDTTGQCWAYLFSARRAIRNGNSKAALNYLNMALDLAKKNNNPSLEALVLCYQSDLYLLLDRPNEALQVAEQAIGLAGADVGGRESIQQFTLALIAGKNSTAALSQLQNYFKNLPTNSSNARSQSDVQRILQGEIAFRNGDYSQSQKLWQDPLKYNIYLLWRNGLALYYSKQYPAAQQQFLALIQRAGFDPERRGVYWSLQNPEYSLVLAHYYLGQIAEITKKPAEAQQYYRQFLTYWGNADFARPEIEEAKKRLAALERR
jgi:serine/threonine protein kinase/tetratricopeptide (TPR) repeat protein